MTDENDGVTLDDIEPLDETADTNADEQQTEQPDEQTAEPEAPELPDSDVDPLSGRRLTSQEKDDRAASDQVEQDAQEYADKMAELDQAETE